MTQADIEQAMAQAAKALREGNAQAAATICAQVLRASPTHAGAIHILAVIAMDSGDRAAAEKLFHRAISIRPDEAEFHNNLGVLLLKSGKSEEAAKHLREAIRLKPDFGSAIGNLAALVGETGSLSESVALNERAVALKPTANTLNNLGNLMMRCGRIAESLATLRKAVELEPDNPNTRSNFLLISNYDEQMSARERFDEHARWGKRLGELVPAMTDHPNDRNPDRRLRVGFLSADFRAHSVAYFLLPFLTRLDRSQVEVFCYSTVTREDEMTQRIRQAADQWRGVLGLPAERIVEIIRQDRIDILVDLATYTSNNNMPVFARKPAPIQVGYLGYPNTSGVAAIDYRITDSIADPVGASDELNVERLVRLDPCAWCYGPPTESPPVAPPPVEKNGYVTFGSFNAISKVNAKVIETWAKILKAVPGSRVGIKSGGFADPPTKERFRDLFMAQGVEPERVMLRGHYAARRDHMGSYSLIDVALDTFPYNGTTTTCEALWMGVPVIALGGEFHAGRVGASLLTNAGMEDWIAGDIDCYIELAVRMAKGKLRLSKLRSGMRKELAESVLMDGSAMARRMEGAFRKMWREWCASH